LTIHTKEHYDFVVSLQCQCMLLRTRT
jgi:hypothetical protein